MRARQAPLLLRAISDSPSETRYFARGASDPNLVQSINAAWERDDFSSVEWAHPEIEFVIADGPSPGSWRGVVGLAEGWYTFLGAWEDFRSEAYEYRELDSERVLVLNRFTGRGKASGVELGQMRSEGASLFHIRDCKVMNLVLYGDLESALADVGLAPEAGFPPS